MNVAFYAPSYIGTFDLVSGSIPNAGDLVVLDERQYVVEYKCLMLDYDSPVWQIDMKES